VSEFPRDVHIVFWRDIHALREKGVEVSLISTRRPDQRLCRHSFAKEASENTHYVYPPQWIPAMSVLASNPLGTLKALAYIAGLKETHPMKRLICLGHLVCAADLLAYCRKTRIDYIYMQNPNKSGHIPALCRILGGPRYCVRYGGHIDVYGCDHASRLRYASFAVVAVRAHVDGVLEKAGFLNGRVVQIWMGVDTAKFVDAGRRSYAKCRLHAVTVARLIHGKGHVYVLQAIRRALDSGVDIEYTIVGCGPDRKLIEDEISRLDLGGNVHLTGTLSEDEVLDLLQMADVFILASVGEFEGAPNAVKEAMSCAMPVICSIVGGTGEMIGHGVDGLLVGQKDYAAISDALIDLAWNPGKRRLLGEAARRKAVALFDYRESASKLIAAMEKYR